MKNFIIFWALLLTHSVAFGQVVIIENNTSVGSCTPATQNVYFYQSGITGSFTVKLYKRIDNEYYYSGCNSSQITEIASANGSTSPLALSIPASLEETNTTRPFGSGSCFLPPPTNYYYRRVYYYLKIVSDVNSNLTNQRSFGIGGSCQTPGVADMNIPLPNICPSNTVTINFNHNGINMDNVFTVAVGSDFNTPLVSTTIAGNTATSATLTIPANASNGSYGVRVSTTDPVSVITYNSVVQVSTSYCPPPSPPTITANPTTVCAGENVSLMATGCTGTVNWSDGGTGSTRTATFSSSTTLTATCTLGGTSGNSNSIPITVNPLPSAPTASGVSINSGSMASITASGCTTYKWYEDSENGGGLLFTGNPFITPILTTDTYYEVACQSGSCESERTSVLVTVTGGTSAILVAHYPFCGNANDATSNANNGMVNGATLVSDRFGNANSAYNFDGNDFISTTNLATSNTDNWAMTAWVKPNSISQNMGTIMLNGFDNGSTGNGYGMLMADGGSGTGNTLFGLFSGVSFYNSGGIFGTNNIWYHITMTRVSGVTKFYINGVQTPNNSGTNPNAPNGSLVIGSMNGIRFWNGAIDDVKVYSSGLTTPEVQTIYTNESVNNAPTITASSNSPVCVGSTLNLVASGGNTYTWNGPNTFTATGETPSIATVTISATGTYTVTGANTYGCTNTATTNVTINPSGTPAANGVTINSGNTASITATGCTIYKWYDLSTGGTLLFTGNPFTSPALTTNTTYHVACSDAPCSETSRASVLVTVNGVGVPPQPGAIVGSNVACQGRAGIVYLVTAVPGATSYTWTYSGTGVTFVGGISNTRTITLDFLYSATSGIISVTANNANGSSPASTMAITLSPAPPAPMASGVTIASGNPASLTATGCFIYKWYSQASGGTVTFTGQNFTTPALTSTTNYYVACNPGTSCESPRVLVTVTVPCTQMISVKTGSWNDPTVWSCNRIPTASDNVIVETGHIVTVPAGTFQVKNVTDRGTLGYALNGILNILGGS